MWREEYEDRLERYAGDEEMARHPDEHRFHIPEGFSWSDVRRHTTDLGHHLNEAFAAIEDANLPLKGIFQDVDFNNKERFPDAVLEKLLQHFETFSLRRADVEPDMLGDAYEYLIAKFADDAGKKGGEFYTPKRVVQLIVRCLDPRPGMSIYDPTAGSGGMLLEAAQHLHDRGENPRSLHLYGQEMNLNTWAICKMNLFLHDIDDANVERGDTLRNPRHLTDGPLVEPVIRFVAAGEPTRDHRVRGASNTLLTFDRVLANPPFSLKQWGQEVWKGGDPFGRDLYGTPPKSYGDLAFVQHMLASLNDRGMLGVVLPHGILFRGGAEAKIRKGMLEADLVEAVIGLAPNLFYGTGIPACVLIANRAKSANREGKVLFINGAEEFEPGKNQNRLSEANVDRLVAAFEGYEDEKGFARVVELEEIGENDWNLNISRYVAPVIEEEDIDVEAELAKLVELRKERDEAEGRMLAMLEELGYGTGA